MVESVPEKVGKQDFIYDIRSACKERQGWFWGASSIDRRYKDRVWNVIAGDNIRETVFSEEIVTRKTHAKRERYSTRSADSICPTHMRFFDATDNHSWSVDNKSQVFASIPLERLLGQIFGKGVGVWEIVLLQKFLLLLLNGLGIHLSDFLNKIEMVSASPRNYFLFDDWIYGLVWVDVCGGNMGQHF